MSVFLNIVEVVLGIMLVTCILLQQKGTGLGSAFGGGSVIYSTKRGIEKTIFRATIVIAVLFFGTAILHLFLG